MYFLFQVIGEGEKYETYEVIEEGQHIETLTSNYDYKHSISIVLYF